MDVDAGASYVPARYLRARSKIKSEVHSFFHQVMIAVVNSPKSKMLLAASKAVFASCPSPCGVAKTYSLSANKFDKSVKVEDSFESMFESPVEVSAAE